LQQPAEEDATGDIDMADADGPVQPLDASANEQTAADNSATEQVQITVNGVAEEDIPANSGAQKNGLPHSVDEEARDAKVPSSELESDKAPSSDTTFLDACFDGTIRVWDRRKPNPIARIRPPQGTPPWCMSACWGTDGNSIYAGRRNNCVEEFSLHKGLRAPERTFRFPAGSGPVSALAAMPNGRHMIWYRTVFAPQCRMTC
jgi:transcriptional activator SPT8